MDTADFVHEFNSMNFDIMAGLDLDHETGLYGMVFFERSEKITKKLKWYNKIIMWFYEKFLY